MGRTSEMGELTLLPGMMERVLPSFDHDEFARALAPVLDAGDIRTATSMWQAWRERADRILRRKRLAVPTREAVLAQLCAAVRLDLYAHRRLPTTACPAPKPRAAATAAVIDFRPRFVGCGQ
jgi:hypothetical protein